MGPGQSSIHPSRGPVVPVFHEQLYADRAAATGNLVQRTISRYGHCTFTSGEMVKAFRDLAGWVETGTRPTP